MINKRFPSIILFLLFFSLASFENSIAQQPDPTQIISSVKAAFNKIKDYQADVSIKIDVEFMDVPDGSARIYFKQPDKISIKSKNFALMPKEGLNFTPNRIFRGNFTPVYVKETLIDGYPVHQIKIVPLEENSEIILTTIWVDKSTNFIRKVESTSRKQGSFTLLLDYGKSLQYPLPTKLTFVFDIKKDNLPKDFTGAQTKKKPLTENVRGKVFVYYNNYQVNKGVPDSVFKENK